MTVRLRFVVDAQLPPALAAFLCAKGHDAVAVREILLRDADDAEIWERARADGAIMVTKDEDFLVRFESAWPELERHLTAGARLVEMR